MTLMARLVSDSRLVSQRVRGLFDGLRNGIYGLHVTIPVWVQLNVLDAGQLPRTMGSR